jgi:hypothetical protein
VGSVLSGRRSLRFSGSVMRCRIHRDCCIFFGRGESLNWTRPGENMEYGVDLGDKDAEGDAIVDG